MHGVELVLSHLDSFTSGQTGDFETQLTPTFRYTFLPPVLGEGPVQARRWRDLLYRIYRDWRFDVADVHAQGAEVVLRLTWRGTNPIEPDVTPPEFFDSAVFVFTIVDGKLAECNASYLEFGEHTGASDDMLRLRFRE